MYQVNYDGFSKKLKSIRVEKDIKQEDVANQLNMSTNTYMSYENDPKTIKIDVLVNLGNVLQIDILKIFLEYVDTKCIV